MLMMRLTTAEMAAKSQKLRQSFSMFPSLEYSYTTRGSRLHNYLGARIMSWLLGIGQMPLDVKTSITTEPPSEK